MDKNYGYCFHTKVIFGYKKTDCESNAWTGTATSSLVQKSMLSRIPVNEYNLPYMLYATGR